MTARIPGTLAPEISLKSIDGKEFSLADALNRGPVVVAFFKITCPVCQFAMPYIERMFRLHRDKDATIVAVSQNDERGTRQFMKEYGLTLPVLLDDPRTYPVSNAYGLTNVPTIFYISREGQIEQSVVGWDRAEIEAMNRNLASDVAASHAPIFQPGEDVPAFKAG